MKKQLLDLVDKLLNKSETKATLKLLQTIFNNAIPFNAPHKFEFHELSDEKARVSVPFIRKNKNHLGGIHACAIATVGEYCAGLILIKKLGYSSYRLIMSELNVVYTKQAVTRLSAEAFLADDVLVKAKDELLNSDKVIVPMETIIYDKDNEEVARVRTTWQLKNWKKVKFKV